MTQLIQAPLIQSVKMKCQILNDKTPMTSIASALVSNCRQFCSSSELSDVTFVVGKGKNKTEFHAIRLWFAMHSSYFKKLLTNNEPVDRIEETDVTALAFEYIYKYFYLQQPSLTANNVVDVLYAANKYELETVVAECDAFIDGTVKENNIVNILLFESRAIALGLGIEHSVRVRFKKWLTVETSLQIIETKAYLNTSQDLLVYLIKHDSFSVPEKDVWIACEAWCNHQIQLISQKTGVYTGIDDSDCDYKEGSIISATTLKQWMSPFIPHIRFTLMENSFFVQTVYKSKILEMKHAMNISLYLMDPTVEINATYIKNITQRHNVVYYHTHNVNVYRESNVLQYSLEMSSQGQIRCTKAPYEDLTNNNIMLDMSTKGGTNNEFIMAKFEKKKFISRMDISPGMTYCECKDKFVYSKSKVQWKNDSNNWIDWSSLTDLKMTIDGKIKTIYDMNIHTTAIRIFDDSTTSVSLGCWRLYGFDSCLRNELGIEQKQMTCAPECVVPPQLPQQPKQNARAYFSDQLIGPKWAIPYDTTGKWSNISDYVGEGSYPINREAFPNASKGTFDAIAIDSNTRVILWEKENFEGKVLLDVIGPKLINNFQFKTSHPTLITDKFQDPDVEKNYPQNVRVWSETNMQPWTKGSVKIVAANS